MTGSKAGLYFANLGADVLRCAIAAEARKTAEYKSSLERAYSTLRRIEQEKRPEAYEEGLLLMRGLEFAREAGTLPTFRENVNDVIRPFASRLGFS